ncbi:MAG: HAD family hydrolase [Candidatus Abawacabacteria bacterium]|nr:HAD family hydrolase [Candidatus Abawacabacteria bacterium]
MEHSGKMVVREQDREGMNPEKFGFGLRVMVRGVLRDHISAYVDSVVDIDPRALTALTGKPVDNLLLDVDGCLAVPEGDILASSLAWVDNLRSRGIHFGVYSNHLSGARLAPLEAVRHIPVYKGTISKPDPRGFLDACRIMGFVPERTWMVGDNPNTDGGGARVLGGFVLVKAIARDKRRLSPWKTVKAPFQDSSRAFAVWRSTYQNPKLITSTTIKAWLSSHGQEDLQHLSA